MDSQNEKKTRRCRVFFVFPSTIDCILSTTQFRLRSGNARTGGTTTFGNVFSGGTGEMLAGLPCSVGIAVTFTADIGRGAGMTTVGSGIGSFSFGVNGVGCGKGIAFGVVGMPGGSGRITCGTFEMTPASPCGQISSHRRHFVG